MSQNLARAFVVRSRLVYRARKIELKRAAACFHFHDTSGLLTAIFKIFHFF
jgi:hypothetical protein